MVLDQDCLDARLLIHLVQFSNLGTQHSEQGQHVD
jgi:hypothetical protein